MQSHGVYEATVPERNLNRRLPTGAGCGAEVEPERQHGTRAEAVGGAEEGAAKGHRGWVRQGEEGEGVEGRLYYLACLSHLVMTMLIAGHVKEAWLCGERGQGATGTRVTCMAPTTP